MRTIFCKMSRLDLTLGELRARKHLSRTEKALINKKYPNARFVTIVYPVRTAASQAAKTSSNLVGDARYIKGLQGISCKPFFLSQHHSQHRKRKSEGAFSAVSTDRNLRLDIKVVHRSSLSRHNAEASHFPSAFKGTIPAIAKFTPSKTTIIPGFFTDMSTGMIEICASPSMSSSALHCLGTMPKSAISPLPSKARSLQ